MKKQDRRRRAQAKHSRPLAALPPATATGNSASGNSVPGTSPAVIPGTANPTPFAQGMLFHQRGDLVAAKQAYCEALRINPKNPDAWHMLGMVLYQAGDSTGARECLEHACQFAPRPWPPQLLSNCGLVFRATGQLTEAKECLEQAVVAKPDFADGWNNLGTVNLECQQYLEAERCFREALRLSPNHAHALTNLGSALHHQRRYRDSQVCHEESLRRFPQDVKTLNNLGAVLRAQRQNEAAAQIFRQAVAIDPRAEEAQINLGRTLVALGQITEAIQVFQQLIATQTASAAAHHHLGHALQLTDRHDDAIRCFEKAVALDPRYAHAISSLGNAKLQRGETAEAVDHLRRSLKLRPDLHETHSNLLFIMSSDNSMSPEQLFAEHQQWGLKYGVVAGPYSHTRRPEESERRLRIGYVSPDLRDHAVARFMEPVLQQYDRARFEVYCYARVYQGDAVTQRLRASSDHWRSTCGLSDEQTAEMIREDDIDILVDLAGHTAGNRLIAFAYKPAPIQISWLGYPNTTGLPAMDYRLTSEIQDPSDEPTYHTEQLVRLAYGTNVYSAPAVAPPVAAPPVERNGYITFGSLHRPQKIAPPVFDLWAAVLQANPTARLYLFNTAFNAELKQYTADQLTAHGIAADRFEIRNQTAHEHYLHEYHQIDIGLDVFPWNGGTTTREAMWMGVAVVGLLGSRRSARGTAATLHYADLPELVARSTEDYVRIATELARDASRLRALRFQLRDRMLATLCNSQRFTRHLEATYRQLWRTWCQSSAAPID